MPIFVKIKSSLGDVRQSTSFPHHKYKKPYADVKYTKSHEWVQSLNAGRFRVGITNHAQQELGEIVHI